MEVLLDYGSVVGGGEPFRLNIGTEYQHGLYLIANQLRDRGVNGPFMLMTKGRYFDAAAMNELSEGDVISVLPVMGGG